MRARYHLMIGAALGAAVCAGPAAALRFEFSGRDDVALADPVARSFRVAGDYWSSILRDDVTVRIVIGGGILPAGTLASTRASTTVVAIRDVYARLATDATTDLDLTAVGRLTPLNRGTGSLTMRVNGFLDSASRTGYSSTATRMDADGSRNNMMLSVTAANARALGIAPVGGRTSDGTIILNDAIAFDDDPRNGIIAGSHDLIGVALREIGHVLGFGSGVDQYDAATGAQHLAVRARAAGLAPVASTLEGTAIGSVLDLYRYNAAGRLDWSTSPTTKYFSIDGRRGTLGGTFASGAINGDGSQAAQWSTAGHTCTTAQGIMGARSCAGTMDHVSALDVAAFDAIGWDARFDALANPTYRISTASLLDAVPEPATWLQLAFGFAMLGLGARRKLVSADRQYRLVNVTNDEPTELQAGRN